MPAPLMPCSTTKAPIARGTTFELYDGPMWQTLRTHKPDALPWGSVLVLSGKYGIIGALSHLSPYEERLSRQKAARLIERGIYAANDHFGTIRANRVTGMSPYAEANAVTRAVRPTPTSSTPAPESTGESSAGS